MAGQSIDLHRPFFNTTVTDRDSGYLVESNQCLVGCSMATEALRQVFNKLWPHFLLQASVHDPHTI